MMILNVIRYLKPFFQQLLINILNAIRNNACHYHHAKFKIIRRIIKNKEKTKYSFQQVILHKSENNEQPS